MDIQIIIGGIGGIVGGLVVGSLIGFNKLKSSTALWEEKLEERQKKLEAQKKESTALLKKERDNNAELEQKVSSATEIASKSKQELDEYRQQLNQINHYVEELEAERNKLQEVVEAQKHERQQTEDRCKQAEVLAVQIQEQAKGLDAQLKAYQAEKASLVEVNQQSTQEIQRLRAALSGAWQGGIQAEAAPDNSVNNIATADGTLEGVLTALMEREGQDSAVLADNNGIVVAAVGSRELKDGIAATSQIIGTLIKQLDGMVPFESLRSYFFQDERSNVIAGRSFDCAGERIGLATYGVRIPSTGTLDAAMANLSALLE